MVYALLAAAFILALVSLAWSMAVVAARSDRLTDRLVDELDARRHETRWALEQVPHSAPPLQTSDVKPWPPLEDMSEEAESRNRHLQVLDRLTSHDVDDPA